MVKLSDKRMLDRLEGCPHFILCSLVLDADRTVFHSLRADKHRISTSVNEKAGFRDRRPRGQMQFHTSTV